jgi:hypothetical protein
MNIYGIQSGNGFYARLETETRAHTAELSVICNRNYYIKRALK